MPDNEIWKYVISGLIGAIASIVVALIAYGLPAIVNRPKTQTEITEVTQEMLKEALLMQKELQKDKIDLKKEIDHLKAAKTADYDLHIIFSIYPEPKIKLAELKSIRSD
jgi:hypothetical protein